MAWCEANGVEYLFGLAKNARLIAEIAADLAAVAEESAATGKPVRRFKDFAQLGPRAPRGRQGRMDDARDGRGR